MAASVCAAPSLEKGRPSQGSRIADRESGCVAPTCADGCRALSRDRDGLPAREAARAVWRSGRACLDPAKVFPGLHAPAHLALSTHLCSPMLRISFPTWSNSGPCSHSTFADETRTVLESRPVSRQVKEKNLYRGRVGIPFSDAPWTCGHGAFGKTVRAM